MPRYHLAILKNNKVNILNIPLIENSKAEDSLKTIDSLTSKFIHENGLIEYLKKINIYKDNNRKVYVIYNYNRETKKLPVVYSDIKKYMEIDYLNSIIQSFSKDIIFIEKIANHFDAGRSTYNPQLANVQVLRGYLNDVRFSESKEPFFAQRVHDALSDILKKAVLKYDRENNKLKVDKKTGEVEINYRGLRDLALFVKKYIDSLLAKEYEKDDFSKDISNFEYSDNYSEPDFPLNSEEEDMYLSYLESLEDEESDYNYEQGKNR